MSNLPAYAKYARHGLRKTPEYGAWAMMKNRCTNPSYSLWHRYGGRGIKVCKRWQSFLRFYEDMGERPSSGHSLERVDNDGNYEPGNCRWATRREQALNRRTNRLVDYKGKTMTVAEAAEATGLHYKALQWRVYQGWSGDKLFSKALRRRTA